VFVFFIHCACTREKTLYRALLGECKRRTFKFSTSMSFQNIWSTSAVLSKWWTLHHWGKFPCIFLVDCVGQNTLHHQLALHYLSGTGYKVLHHSGLMA